MFSFANKYYLYLKQVKLLYGSLIVKKQVLKNISNVAHLFPLKLVGKGDLWIVFSLFTSLGLDFSKSSNLKIRDPT